MKNFILVLILINSSQLFSQVEFQKGYIIFKGEKKECLIQNDNWLNTPSVINYKLSENSPVIISETNLIQELYIYNTNQKYLLAPVKRPLLKQQSKQDILLLKYLISGKASLFSYMDKGNEQFFYKIGDSNITQLIYKKSKNNRNSHKNNSYKQQLFKELKCNSITLKKLNSINYNKSSLINIFKTYNLCTNSDYKNFHKDKPKGKFHLSVLGGSSVVGIGNVDKDLSSEDGISMNSKNSYKIGLDAELRFPFNRNKWSLFLELNYSNYKAKGTYLLSGTNNAPSNPGATSKERFSFKTNFSMLEIPIGFRHYSFINSKNSLFYSAAMSFNTLLSSDKDIVFDSRLDDVLIEDSQLKSDLGFNIGIGYKYNLKFGAEIRYSQTNIIEIKELSGNSKSLSILFRYKI